jgi:hypothetical protein
MFHPTVKYQNEQGSGHKGQLHWPGVNGLPFLGQAPPNIRQHELEQLPIVGYACHQLFNLSDDDQSKVYGWVRDRIKNGLFALDWVYRHFDEQEKVMWIYIEWTQLYVMMPPNYLMGSNGNGSPSNFTLRGTG